MTGTLPIPRKLIIVGIVIPLAMILGLLMATPEDFTSLAGVFMVLGALSIPIFLRWHYPLLILSWNAAVIIAFLPGEPHLWMLMACISFFLTVLNYIMNRSVKPLVEPTLSVTLVLFAMVIVGTAFLTGGVGLRSMGSAIYGGRKYFTILFAILGFFAISTHRIPIDKAYFYVSAFLLAGLTLGVGNIAYLMGDSFFWVFYLFPVDYVVNQATEDFYSGLGGVKFGRLSGLTWAGLAVFCWMLVRYGLRGILDLNRPWRLGAVLFLFAISLLGGFRSIVVIYLLLILLQGYWEGLHRTRMFPALMLGGVVAYALLIPAVSLFPLSAQRSLTILPFMQVDTVARADASASTEWRLRMWDVLLDQVPRYFWIGKGYTANATDYWLAIESFRRGFSEDYEASLIAGDYHNGPLSVLLPFGIWGALLFIAFVVLSIRALYLNYKYGPAELKLINTFFLSYFLTRIIFFVAIFGGVTTDMWMFAGIVAMSVSVNHGVAKAPVRPEPAPASRRLTPIPV